ncbi:MAG: glycosyltransferase, partial [Candidatus Woesebacteria bacterium]|nr:glycosyltransferase [Candidatus Woesebacteria bacterium]
KRVISIRNNNNLKTSVTLNRGLRIAKGKYVVRMDADDWSYPDRLQKQYDYIEEHPNVGVSGGTIEVCDKNLRVINEREYPLTDEGVRRIIFCFSPFAHPATIWNAKIMKKVGGYNANIPLSQDCELYFKVGQSAKFGNIKEVLIKLRTHSTSSSVSKNLLQEKYAIYARIKAIIEYGYHPRFIDRLYILGRIAAMVFIPTKLKFWLFNLVRGEK